MVEASPLAEDAGLTPAAVETSGWPSWESSVGFDDQTDAHDADVHDDMDVADIAASSEPTIDLEPLAPVGAGIAPAGDVALQPDEIGGGDAVDVRDEVGGGDAVLHGR